MTNYEENTRNMSFGGILYNSRKGSRRTVKRKNKKKLEEKIDSIQTRSFNRGRLCVRPTLVFKDGLSGDAFRLIQIDEVTSDGFIRDKVL